MNQFDPGILLQGMPPWVVLGGTLGLIGGALFHLLLGRSLRSLPLYLLLGVGGGVLGGLASFLVPPSRWDLGDLSLPLVAASTFAPLLFARLLRL